MTFQFLRSARNVAAVLLAALAGVLAAPAAKAETIKIVALGDSLTAGLGLPPGDAFPVRLQAALTARGHDVVIENAGVSGDTASAGAERLDWAVPDDARGVILELGANDALRGVDPRITRQALERIMKRLKERNIPVLIAGMYAPRNLGPAYTDAFDAIYPALAKEYGAMLYPFFLDGVAQNPALNQGDGIHPNAQGVGKIVEAILPTVESFLGRIRGKS